MIRLYEFLLQLHKVFIFFFLVSSILCIAVYFFNPVDFFNSSIEKASYLTPQKIQELKPTALNLAHLQKAPLLQLPNHQIKAFYQFDPLSSKTMDVEMNINNQVFQLQNHSILYLQKDKRVTTHKTAVKMEITKQDDQLEILHSIDQTLVKKEQIPIETRFHAPFSFQLDWYGEDLLENEHRQKVLFQNGPFFLKQGDCIQIDLSSQMTPNGPFYLHLDKVESNHLHFIVIDKKGRTKTPFKLEKKQETVPTQNINLLQFVSLRSLKSAILVQKQKRIHLNLSEPLYFYDHAWHKVKKENVPVLILKAFEKKPSQTLLHGTLYSAHKSKKTNVQLVKYEDK